MNTQKSFTASLSSLLERYCNEPLLSSLLSDLNKMNDSEKKAVSQARVESKELNIIENSFLENIKTRCKQELPAREYGELIIEIGNLCISFGEFSHAKECYGDAVAIAKDNSRFSDIAGRALVKRSEINIRHTAWKASLQDLRDAQRFYSKPKNILGLADVESNSGVLYASQGNLKKAYGHFKKALSLYEKVKNADMTSTTLMNLGIVANIKGQYNDAVTFFQRALPQFEQAGDMARLPEVHHNLGMALLSKRDYEAAITQFDESLTYSTRLSFEPMIGISLLGKASAYAKYGDNILSIAYTNNALNIFRKLNDHLSIADAYKLKGVVQREMKNLDIAEIYLQTSIRLNTEHNNLLNLGESLYELGLLYKARNDKSKSSDALKKSMTYFKSVGAEQDLQLAKAELSRLN